LNILLNDRDKFIKIKCIKNENEKIFNTFDISWKTRCSSPRHFQPTPSEKLICHCQSPETSVYMAISV